MGRTANALLAFKMSAKPQPLTLHVPDADIEDLRARLARTRLPDQVPNARWEYGADLSYMRSLIEYWRTTFDWRAQVSSATGGANAVTRTIRFRLHDKLVCTSDTLSSACSNASMAAQPQFCIYSRRRLLFLQGASKNVPHTFRALYWRNGKSR
jgi:hypothetical protein